jgi:Tetratricopeptide repeat
MKRIIFILGLFLFSMAAICQKTVDYKAKTKVPQTVVKSTYVKTGTDEGLLKVAPSEHIQVKTDQAVHVAESPKDNTFKQKIYNPAIQNYPDYWKVLNNAALVYIDNKEYAKALKILLKADSLSPNNGVILNNLGVVYAFQNELNKSRVYFRESIRLGENVNSNLKKLDSIRIDIPISKSNFSLLSATQSNQKEALMIDSVVAKDGTPAMVDIKAVTKNILGRLNYRIDTTMVEGQTYTINLTISNNVSKESLIKSFPEFNHGNLMDTLIRISSRMKCRLIDPVHGNFRISYTTDSIQSVSMMDKTYTRWQWQVTPLKPGKNALTLDVDIYNGEDKQSVNIYNGFIHVTAIPVPWYRAIFSFIDKEWDKIVYILSAIIIPLVVFYRKKILKIFSK